MSETVIQVNDLGKQYRLGQIGTGALSHDINRFWCRLRGKEDPYLKVGEVNDRSVKGTSDWVWALKDVNFEVKKGEVLGIIGKNGAGKSTLLKILSQVTSPTIGEIKIKGRIAALLEVGTGFHPELTGRENIFLNGAILGMTKAEVKSKLDEIIAFSGVEKYVDTPVKRYSSGMMVRLAFAVAAHLEPEILIVDEVLAVGDAEFQEKCIGKMKDVSSHGRTVLFVSHNLGVINQLCSRVILLKNGSIIANDTPNNVIEQYLNLEKSETSNTYFADLEKVKSKEMFFSEITTLNNKNIQTDRFGSDEKISFKIQMVIERNIQNAQIGIGLLDKHKNRIFTVVRPVSKVIAEPILGKKEVYVELPANLIAPNTYSFLFALFIPKGEIIEILESECRIRVYDAGTELAKFEGLDYGSVLVDSTWNEIK